MLYNIFMMKKIIALILIIAALLSAVPVNTFAEGYNTFYNLVFINDEFIDRMLRGGVSSVELEEFLNDIDSVIGSFQETIYEKDMDVYFITIFLQSIQKEEFIDTLLAFDAMYQEEMIYMLQERKVPKSMRRLMEVAFANKVRYERPAPIIPDEEEKVPEKNPEPQEPVREMPFSDITPEMTGSEAICWLYDRGFVNGKEDGLFHPADYITREEVLKILVSVFLETSEMYERDYGKRAEGKWYHPWFASAEYYAVIAGVFDEEYFADGRPITRQDIVTVLYRCALRAKINLPKIKSATDFYDMNEFRYYAVEPVRELQKAGILKGTGNNLFSPHGFITRGEAAQLIYDVITVK